MAQPAPPLPPSTTHEQDLHTAGQRAVNMTWERTQAGIAIAMVAANIAYEFTALVWEQQPSQLLSAGLFTVVGFYFGRTNHSRIGGGASLDDRDRKG